MNKRVKTIICLLSILIFFVSFTVVNATEDVDVETEEVTEVIEENASDQKDYEVFNPSTKTSVTNINSYENANLQLNNVLCIILIAIGVVLILFAIAILIGLKG